MTRSKKSPSVHKPPFDEENILRFAEMEPASPVVLPLVGEDGSRNLKDGEPSAGKFPQPDRKPVTLLLKAETIASLQHEAGRKEKTIDQVIDKLVAKHLGRHK